MRILSKVLPLFLCFITLSGCAKSELPVLLTGDKSALRYRDIPWYITSEELIKRENLPDGTFDHLPYTGGLPENIVRKEPVWIEGLPLSAYISYRFLSEGQGAAAGLHEIVLVFFSEDESACMKTRNLVLERLHSLAPPLSKPGEELSLEDAKNASATDTAERVSCQAEDLSRISVAVYPPDVTGRAGQYGAYVTLQAGKPV